MVSVFLFSVCFLQLNTWDVMNEDGAEKESKELFEDAKVRMG